MVGEGLAETLSAKTRGFGVARGNGGGMARVHRRSQGWRSVRASARRVEYGLTKIGG